MTDEEKERVDKFLNEYERICRQFRMIIGGCGCCGSPYILGVDDRDESFTANVEHLRKEVCL